MTLVSVFAVIFGIANSIMSFFKQGPIADIGTLFDNTMFSESFRGKGYSLYNISIDPDSSTMAPTTEASTITTTDVRSKSSYNHVRVPMISHFRVQQQQQQKNHFIQ